MTEKRYVNLDTSYYDDVDWVALIIAAPTGVVYRNQYGGYSCLPGHIEGYVMPIIDGLAALPELRDIFEKELLGSGTNRLGFEWSPTLLDRLRAVVADVGMQGLSSSMDHLPGPSPYDCALKLDEARLGEADEAWVPVITSDGPGILTWPNSD